MGSLSKGASLPGNRAVDSGLSCTALLAQSDEAVQNILYRPDSSQQMADAESWRQARLISQFLSQTAVAFSVRAFLGIVTWNRPRAERICIVCMGYSVGYNHTRGDAMRWT